MHLQPPGPLVLTLRSNRRRRDASPSFAAALLLFFVTVALPSPGWAQADTLLTSGVTYDGGSTFGLFAGGGSQTFFRIVVPAGQSKLTVETGGGQGDVDLYVRRGARPTLSLYDGASAGPGTNETVVINNPAADTYYIMLAGYGDGYLGTAVRATYSSGAALPTWQWAQSTASDNASGSSPALLGVAVDATANAYFCGWFQGVVQFGQAQLTATAVTYPGLLYGQSGVLVKYSPAGQVVWAANNVGEQATALAVSSDGFVYATGSFTGTVRFSSTVSLTTSRRSETFVAKYQAANGTLVWAKSFPGVGDNVGMAIAVSPADGSVIVGGYETRATTRVPSGTQIARWLRLDANGMILQNASLVGDDYSAVAGVAVDGSNQIYLAGAFKSNLPLPGGGTLTSAANSNGNFSLDGFFVKLAPGGAVLWSASFDHNGADDAATAVALDTTGGVLASGVTGNGHFALRYNSSGARTWLMQSSGGAGFDYPTSIVSDGRGGALWGGTFVGTFDLGTASLTSSSRSSPCTYLIAMTASGVLQWAGTNDGRASAFAADSLGDIYIGGAYFDVSSFGATALTTNRREIFFGRLVTAIAPTITAQPGNQSGVLGGSVTFSTTVTGPSPITYQWQKNGASIAGATSSTLVLTSLKASDAGTYTVIVTNGNGSTTSTAATLTVSAAASRLVNMSVRSVAGSGDKTLIVGFSTSGSGPKQVLIRGIGPTLGQFGVSGAVADPVLNVFDGTQNVASNDNWGGTSALSQAFDRLQAFGLPAGSKDAALLVTLPPKAYSAQVNASAEGIALVELYDADAGSPASRLVNLSARDQVTTGQGVLVIGFVITGNAPETLLIRGIGPTLGQFGVSGALGDPRIDLYSGQSVIQSNDNWGGTSALSQAFDRVQAFGLPSGSKDAALLATLSPGAYTVQVSGVAGATGIALVEVYEMP